MASVEHLTITTTVVRPPDNFITAELSELKAILDGTAHLVVPPERLTVVGDALASYPLFEEFLATLHEASQPPRKVIVKRGRNLFLVYTLQAARFIQVWKDLKHPNVLGLLGYTLNHENKIDQLISPYLINANLRDFLNQTPVGVAQRLGFRGIRIGENLNAVLLDCGPRKSYNLPFYEDDEYQIPEELLGKSAGVASDVWGWGCAAFEASAFRNDVLNQAGRLPRRSSLSDQILTDKRPFEECEGGLQVFSSIIQRKAPGQPDMLLSLVPDAPKPEYASTLRLLHSYLPLCWEYEPKKRPPISLLRHQVFMFSFEEDAGDSVVATLEELAHLLIPPERLRIVDGSQLGEGNYGEVVLGTLDEASSTPRDVAVKRLKAVGTRGERVRLAKRLARELNIWAKTKHPNVVELIGYYLDGKFEAPLLISALMANGNVLDYIERYKPDIERRIAFVKGITAGLACLHNFDPAICHADLKPANVLIDLQMNAVLCDFGLASFVSGSGDLPGLVTTTSVKGTPRYMSPELLLDSDCKHSLESDVWAWACTVFQVDYACVQSSNLC
ncbi:hypothetical protein FRC05_007689 [Tulasnella sp. 425]|nr:hypothetical protein FRC05_007689 [Tulasnella sp. 425]